MIVSQFNNSKQNHRKKTERSYVNIQIMVISKW